MNRPRIRWVAILGLLVWLFWMSHFGLQTAQAVPFDADVDDAVTISCAEDEATIAARGGPRASLGGATVYVGYQQVSSNNQNPIVVQFSGGERQWCRTDYEQTGVDGTAYGVFWDAEGLYVIFSVDGGSYDFNFGASNGWLSSYGAGGGPKIAVISQLDPATGDPLHGTFLSAVLSNGKTNSLVARDICRVGDEIRVLADSWYAPRHLDGRRIESCEGSSPLDYAIAFSLDLTTARAVSSVACGVMDEALSTGCAADLYIAPAARPARVSAGDAVTYTLAFGNAGGLSVPDSAISATLPAPFALHQIAHAGMPLTLTTQAPPFYAWDGAPLPPNSAGILTFTGRVTTTTPPGFYPLHASISSSASDATPSNNEATITLGVDVLSTYLPVAIKQ